mmetsp:Transcript_20425/g.44425  ORF Transcript_20425/g.44425 Transcript_20425/m.44425 type:complete len:200 (-) Transcript_20425:738-1337(-)
MKTVHLGGIHGCPSCTAKVFARFGSLARWAAGHQLIGNVRRQALRHVFRNTVILVCGEARGSHGFACVTSFYLQVVDHFFGLDLDFAAFFFRYLHKTKAESTGGNPNQQTGGSGNGEAHRCDHGNPGTQSQRGVILHGIMLHFLFAQELWLPVVLHDAVTTPRLVDALLYVAVVIDAVVHVVVAEIVAVGQTGPSLIRF